MAIAAGGGSARTPTRSNHGTENTNRPPYNQHSAHNTNKRNTNAILTAEANVIQPTEANTTGSPNSQLTLESLQETISLMQQSIYQIAKGIKAEKEAASKERAQDQADAVEEREKEQAEAKSAQAAASEEQAAYQAEQAAKREANRANLDKFKNFMMKMILKDLIPPVYTTAIPKILMTNSQETSLTLTNPISSLTSGSIATKSLSLGLPPLPDANEQHQPDKYSKSIETTQLSLAKYPPSDDAKQQVESQSSRESTAGRSPVAPPSPSVTARQQSLTDTNEYVNHNVLTPNYHHTPNNPEAADVSTRTKAELNDSSPI